ncbi:MAG TPA: DUF4388 domain-containing protein [Fibrobacteria bacterium]|nr:DUF4388 domain-containing protein [Fibrobacteria bacterium]
MILSGDLKDFSLADVLQLLLQQHKSGVLGLENGKEKAELYISQGNITGVRVNGRSPDDKVRDMLVESGRVPAREMSELTRISADMNRPLLATLIAKGCLAEADKEEWLQSISEDMVCDLFTWVGGRYEFGTNLKAQGAGFSHMNLSTEFACMEGMRRIDEWPRLREGVPDDKVVFTLSGKPYDGDEMSWDRLVLGLVDGRRTAEAIGRQLPFGSFRLAECLVNLLSGGFIVPVLDAGGDPGPVVHSDPESERDRKTAMVVGASVLLFMIATTVRLIALWMMNLGAPVPTGAEARITRALARENVEAFLIDHAARKDAFPADLDALVRDGALAARELRDFSVGTASKTLYHKSGDRGYILK